MGEKMKIKKCNRIIVFTLFLFFSGMSYKPAAAEMSVGLGYPYLGLKFAIAEPVSIEAKYAFGDGVDVLAGRGYWNFFYNHKVKAFLGAEAGALVFNAEGLEGKGFEYGAFIGGEYKIADKLGITMDIGPAVISLDAEDINIKGVEWIITVGIYWTIF